MIVLKRSTFINKIYYLTSYQNIYALNNIKLPRHKFQSREIKDKIWQCTLLNNKKYYFSNYLKKAVQRTSLYLIKFACETLIKIDPICLDNLCLTFGQKYILSQIKIQQKIREKSQSEILQQFKKLAKNEKQNINEKQLFQSIKLIYQFLNGSKIGFLRGDIHTTTIFKLNIFVEQRIKIEQQTNKRQEIQFQKKDFQNLFKQVTQPTQFRLPKHGICNRILQSKINLYYRQLILEQVSSQQSHHKFQQILQSLLKLNKIQQAQCARKFLVDWILPVTGAIKDQQSQCVSNSLTASRKLYAQYLISLDAEKIATVALTQVIIDIFESINKNYGSLHHLKIQQFEGIQQRKFINKIMRHIEAQIIYEKQQKIFKQTQKQYDQLIKNMKQKNKNKQTQKQQKQNQDMDISNNDQKLTKQSQIHDINNKGKVRYWKSEEFMKKQKNSPFKYVHPEKRKQFLTNLLSKAGRMNSKKSFIPPQISYQIGSLIVYILKQVVKIQNDDGYKVDLFNSQNKFIKEDGQYKALKLLQINDNFLKQLLPKLQKSQDMFIHMQRAVPTIIQPLAWLQPQIGGYYSQATSVMRYSNCPVQERILKYADNYRVFEVLNNLSRVPWKINKDVLNIVQLVWQQGGDLQNCIPKRYSQVLNSVITQLKNCTDWNMKKQLNNKIQKLRDQHSLRSDFLLKLNLARIYSKLDRFFFPHNLDFRGRVYPIPPHFNHIGNDLSRGLLLFAQKKRLGKDGLKWLKIHTANLMEKDKAPIPQKLVFIQQNMEMIHKMAQKPMVHRRWLKYQDCWQAISSIIDLSRAMKLQNPQNYESCLHIHQDGSCNGLQHYAALGRDFQGAYQVNLGPSQKPSDIYSHVARMVTGMIKQDVNNEDATVHILARKLTDQIKRKTIKQTVMTSVYGVTFIGAREQIYRQLRDQRQLSQQDAYAASLYVAKLTLIAISNLFTGAHGIKKWFKECATLVSRTGNPLGWISPLGLPIVQPYRKQSKFDVIKTVSSNMHIPRQIQNVPINSMKQATAFPPNFIHSLDSSHMMYTAEQCKKRNIQFAAVHDSYWTHAANVEEMNAVLRDQFIKLHSEPILQNFKASLESRFPQILFPQIPKRGNFDLQKIKESVYFFS